MTTSKPTPASRFETLDITSTLNTAPPALDFVFNGILAGSVGLLVASGGVGKSNLALQLLTSIATGNTFADGAFPAPSKSGRAVYFSGEDDTTIIKTRLHTLANHLAPESAAPLLEPDKRKTLIDTLQCQLDIRFINGKPVNIADVDSPDIEPITEICKGARIAIFDTLRRFHKGDENSSGDMTQVIHVLEQIARTTGCAILVLHHANKAATLNSAADNACATRGSSALTDNVRWQGNLIRMSEAEAKEFGISLHERGFYLRFEVVKANYIPPQAPIWLKRLPGGVLTHAPLKSTKGIGTSKHGKTLPMSVLP